MESRRRAFVLYMIIMMLISMLLLSTTAAVASNIMPPSRGCRSKCGGVDIPYPFDIDPNCSLPGFALSCNDIGNGVYKPFYSNVEFINISLSSGQAHIYNRISSRCYNSTSKKALESRWIMNLAGTPYRFSDTRNKFVTIGCETLAYIRVTGRQNNRYSTYSTACVSLCYNDKSLSNGLCSGMGCCQTSIPKGMTYSNVSFDHNFTNSDVWQFNPCSYAVLLEESSFNFKTSYLSSDEFNRTTGGRVPLVLDWAIGTENCHDARRNATAYACVSENSGCVDSPNGPGYLCNCSSGYEGNPYVHGGCKDINECGADSSPCSASATCNNTPGNFTCSCPPGTHGNPYGSGNYCYQNQKLAVSVKLMIGNPSPPLGNNNDGTR